MKLKIHLSQKLILRLLIGAAAGIWITLFGYIILFNKDIIEAIHAPDGQSTILIAVALTFWFGLYIAHFYIPKLKIKQKWIRYPANTITGLLVILFLVLGFLVGIAGAIAYPAYHDLMKNNAKEPYLTWTANTSTTMTINWQSLETEYGSLMYGTDPSNMTEISSFENEPKLVHHYTIQNLIPGTLYYYKVKGFEKRYTFTTAGLPTANSKLKFIVYGDNRYGNEFIVGPFRSENHHRDLIAQMSKMYISDNKIDINFTINVGDLVLRGGDTPQWTVFHREISPIASHAPYMISVGNHEFNGGDTQYTEMDAWHMRHYWAYNNDSGDELNYWFTIGNAFFLVFNSGKSGLITQEQVNWINKTLTTYAKDYDWVFTINHHPLVNMGAFNYNLMNPLGDIFRNNGVDVSLTGHVHNYQRYENQTLNWTHIITGGGGAGLRSIKDEDLNKTNFCASEYHFTEWAIENNHAHVRVIDENGGIIEEFDLYTENTINKII